jgi:hypothetical protein
MISSWIGCCPGLSVELAKAHAVRPYTYYKGRGGFIYGRAAGRAARDRDRTALSFLSGRAP